MKGPSKLNPMPPQNSDAFIFPDNFIDFVLGFDDKWAKLIFPVDASKDLTYIQLWKYFHKNLK